MSADLWNTTGKKIRVAIDAKYKQVDPEADIYQALAYAKALNLQRVALVYPADGNVASTTHRIRNDDVSVLVRTVPVGSGAAGFSDLDKRAAKASVDLIGELVEPIIAPKLAPHVQITDSKKTRDIGMR